MDSSLKSPEDAVQLSLPILLINNHWSSHLFCFLRTNRHSFMTDPSPSDSRSGYISAILSQRIHELLTRLSSDSSDFSATELETVAVALFCLME